MKIAILQTPVYDDLKRCLNEAREAAAEAARNGADLAVLPEMFCCPYANAEFARRAEPAGGRIWTAVSAAAHEIGIPIVAGSMPERDGDRIYNTSFVFDAAGAQIARHRKLHMFDIDVQGGQHFRESDTLTPGDAITMFEVGGYTFGLCICFDIRFPELFRAMALRGAEAVIVPACFNMTTGPKHWELCFRARAVDNQIYTIGAAAARDENAAYVSYANSIACDPWGNVLARAGDKRNIVYARIDHDTVREVRRQLPFLTARRTDLY